MTDKDACVLLNLMGGIGNVRLNNICSLLKISPRDIFSQSETALARIQGIGKKLAQKIVAIEEHADLDKEYALADKAGVKVLTIYDDEYPAPLKQIYDAPICLYIRGELPDTSVNSIAIVGSRRITNYGRRMAEFIAESAAYAGWTVVSGLAYGIDSVAHKAVLNVKGRTVAVLGGGLMRIHPQDHVPLARQIIEQGAVISEFPMEFSPNRRSFPMRNRIISGLALGVVVIEAGLNSGSLITANFALEQGRPVFAVPGEVENPQAKGCNSLIKQGAKLTESFEDIIEEFEFLPGLSPGITGNKSQKYVNTSAMSEKSCIINHDLSPEEQKIIDVMSSGGSESIDNISGATELQDSLLLSLLMQLEMKGIIEELPGNRYKLRNFSQSDK